MNLPRILIEVASGPPGPDGQGDGWTVVVTAAADGSELVAPYTMDSTTLEVNGRNLKVPMVPESRRQHLDEPFGPLCGDADKTGALLGRLARQRPKADDVLAYGRWLFECLLAPAWQAVRTDPGVAAARGVELALVWHGAHADLHSLVWEAMADDQNRPLAGLPDALVVVTRVVAVKYPEREMINRVPKVLFASGASATDEVIRPGLMFMGLLRQFDADGSCVSRAAPNVSLSKLQQECYAFAPDVVHLVAHGEPRPGGGSVLLFSDHDAREEVGAGQLLHALTAAGGTPMSVVLSACHSGGGSDGPVLPGPPAPDQDAPDEDEDEAQPPVTWRATPLAAELVAGGIPIVIAMAGAVSEPACRMFTTRLVDSIHKGEPLCRAAAEGRAAALAAAPKPSRYMDWAMPAIFVADWVKPDFRPLDPAPAGRLVTIADHFSVRIKPVFIGRHKILKALDELFPSAGQLPPGCVAICSENGLDKLGSTRLLQEIGFRLVRAGHVPLLLANYPEASTPGTGPEIPRSLRGFLYALYYQAIEVLGKFELPPPRLRAVGEDPRFAGHDAVTGKDLAGKDPLDARQEARRVLDLFQMEPEQATAQKDLKATLVRELLKRDIAELAGIMAQAGEPFGSHTRVVVLADKVHEWTGALGPLLTIADDTGLGTGKSPAPLVLTAATGTPEGRRLQTYLSNTGNVARHELGKLTIEEATLGFQWVLLNEWHPKDEYKRVYVAARTTTHEMTRDIFKVLDGKPANVTDILYVAAETALAAKRFEANNDEAALTTYAEAHR
jgi:hypothetical protein